MKSDPESGSRPGDVGRLRDSGSWDRGGFDGSTPEEVVDPERPVDDEGYGGKEKSPAAKRVIDRV